MTDQSGDQVQYADPLLGGDRRLAILATGERKGLWIFHAQQEGSYLVEQGGTCWFLTPSEVDRLPFEYFVKDGKVDLPLA